MNTKGGSRLKRTKYMIIILVILIAAGFLTTIIKTNHSSQALTAFLLPIRFVGEYSLGDEPWRELTPVSKLPVDDRELRLRGHFDIDFTLDEVMFLYLDHTDVIIKVNGQERVNTFMPTERMAEDFCGVYWYDCLLQGVTKDDYIEILLHSAHDFGHNSAYRDFIDRIYTAQAHFLRGVILQMGSLSRTVALIGAVLSLLIMGFSLAFSRMGFSSGGKLTILGLSSLLMSGYIALDTPDVALWSEVILTNTSGLHLCMMLAALGFCYFIVDMFESGKKRSALVALAMLTILDGTIILLSSVRVVRICSMQLIWVIGQSGVCAVLLGYLVHLFFNIKTVKEKYLLLVLMAMQILILIDLAGSILGWRHAGICSKTGFILLLLIFLAWTMHMAPEKYRQAMRAHQLEGELEESHVAVMVSQIHPHFLFNSLSAIRHLCRTCPELAWEALGDFATYLRANTDALASTKLIPFSQELRHIQSYLKLEKLRMDERLSIVYDIQEEDFLLPPLTVQPLIENAVKHGIFYARNGGTVRLATFKQGSAVVIEVSDDGVGFNMEENFNADDRVHVGIHNVQTRLSKMLRAQMTVKSEMGKGTTVTIRIG